MISDEAVAAAAKALWQTNQHDDAWVSEFPTYMDYLHAEATKVLEAAAPYMLSHERQQTADAHRDAIVNRDTVDRLERELETAKADAWDEAAASIIDEHGNPIIPTNVDNPYRSQA